MFKNKIEFMIFYFQNYLGQTIFADMEKTFETVSISFFYS